MKNVFYKKVIWGLILIIAFGLISVGCMGVTPPPPPLPLYIRKIFGVLVMYG